MNLEFSQSVSYSLVDVMWWNSAGDQDVATSPLTRMIWSTLGNRSVPAGDQEIAKHPTLCLPCLSSVDSSLPT